MHSSIATSVIFACLAILSIAAPIESTMPGHGIHHVRASHHRFHHRHALHRRDSPLPLPQDNGHVEPSDLTTINVHVPPPVNEHDENHTANYPPQHNHEHTNESLPESSKEAPIYASEVTADKHSGMQVAPVVAPRGQPVKTIYLTRTGEGDSPAMV